MGYLNEDGQWCTGEQDEVRKARKQAATTALGLAHRANVDRPIEEATGTESDPIRRSAKQLLALSRHGMDPKHIGTELALEQQTFHPDAKPTEIGAAYRTMVDELASDFDTNVEAIRARTDEAQAEDFSDWLDAKYGLTPGEVVEGVEQLPETTRQATFDMLQDEYESDPEEQGSYQGDPGYGDAMAEYDDGDDWE
jgi:hypothetical protein